MWKNFFFSINFTHGISPNSTTEEHIKNQEQPIKGARSKSEKSITCKYLSPKQVGSSPAVPQHEETGTTNHVRVELLKKQNDSGSKNKAEHQSKKHKKHTRKRDRKTTAEVVNGTEDNSFVSVEHSMSNLGHKGSKHKKKKIMPTYNSVHNETQEPCISETNKKVLGKLIETQVQPVPDEEDILKKEKVKHSKTSKSDSVLLDSITSHQKRRRRRKRKKKDGSHLMKTLSEENQEVASHAVHLQRKYNSSFDIGSGIAQNKKIVFTDDEQPHEEEGEKNEWVQGEQLIDIPHLVTATSNSFANSKEDLINLAHDFVQGGQDDTQENKTAKGVCCKKSR